MKLKNYEDIFRTLGIKTEPVPMNYTPEQYGKMLMSCYPSAAGVSYSAQTDMIIRAEDKYKPIP